MDKVKDKLFVGSVGPNSLDIRPDLWIGCGKLQNKSQLYTEDFTTYKRDSTTRGESLHLAVTDSHQSNTAARSCFNNAEPTHACLLTASSALVRFAGMPDSEWNQKQNFGNRCIIYMGFTINIQNKQVFGINMQSQ